MSEKTSSDIFQRNQQKRKNIENRPTEEVQEETLEEIDYKTEYEQLLYSCNDLHHEYELLQKKFLFSERRYNQLEEQYNTLFNVIDELLKIAKGEDN